MGNAMMPQFQAAGMPPPRNPADPVTMEYFMDAMNRVSQAIQWPPGYPGGVPPVMEYNPDMQIDRSNLEAAVMGLNGALSQLPSSRRPPPLVLGQRAPQETVEAYADYMSEMLHKQLGQPYQKRQPNPAYPPTAGSNLPYPPTAGSNLPYPATTGSSPAYPPTQATSDTKSLPTGPGYQTSGSSTFCCAVM